MYNNRAEYIISNKRYWRTGYYNCYLESLELYKLPVGSVRLLVFDKDMTIPIEVISTKRWWFRHFTKWKPITHENSSNLCYMLQTL